MPTPPLVHFPPFRLDLDDERLWRGDTPLRLTHKAFGVLRALLEAPGQLVTKDTLFAAVWAHTAVSEAVLTTCMRELRRVLQDSVQAPRYIETVRGRGYRFVAAVTRTARLGPLASAALLAPLPPGRLVGREAALAQLQAHYARARQGARQLVWVTGEPGIGKTALVEAFVTQVATADAVWVGRGQCLDQYGAGEAYLPVLEALGRLGRGPEGVALLPVLQQYAPSWLVHLPALLSPEDRERLAHLASGVTPSRMLRELAEALEVLTAERLLVLVLEDLHWSDGATLEWLAYVVRRRDPARLLLLGTYRPADVMGHAHPLRPLLADLRLHPQCAELGLDALSAPAVAAYLGQRCGAMPVPPGLSQFVHQRTRGHPLFVVTLVDELVRQRILEPGDEAGSLQGDLEAVMGLIPPSLRQFIEAQVERLPRADQALLEAASVAGAEFTVAAVAAALEHAVEAVEARCAALAHQGQFLQTCGRAVWPDSTVTACYSFRHALYQEVVYQRIPAGRQTRWHARIGLRLAHGFGAQAGDIAAALAMHFLRGYMLPQAVQYLSQAGQQAVRRGAHQEAVTCYEQALHALQPLPSTPDTLAQAIDLHLALDEALFPLGAFQRVCDTLREAERLAEALGDHRRLGWVSEALSVSYRRIGTYDQAVVFAQRAMALAVALGDAAMQAWAAFRLGQAAYFLGDYPRARDSFQQVIASPPEPGEVSGDPVFLPAHARSWLVYCLSQRGAFDDGLVVGAEAVRIAEAGEFPTSRCAAYASLGGLYRERGALHRAIPLLEQSLELCQRWHDLDWFPECAASLGLAYALAGRLTEALPLLEQAVEQETGMGGGHASIGLPKLSQGYLLAGRLEEARAYAERALVLAHERQERGFQAWALQLLGDIAVQCNPPEVEPATASYRQALALAEDLGMQPLQAHCHCGLGTLYTQIGQREQARAALSTATEMYQVMEMTFWLPQAERALARVEKR